MSTPPGKTCPRCEVYKLSSAFKLNRRRKDKLAVHCRDCEAALIERAAQQPKPVRGKTKLCAGCATVKPYTAFNKGAGRSDGLQTYCRDCQRVRDRENYAKNAKRREQVKVRRIENNQKYTAKARAFIADYLKSHPCVDCGETHLLKLQFDHVRGEKANDLSLMVSRGYTLKRIKEEVAKCEVRCANCHIMKTARDFNYRVYTRYQEMQNE